LRVTNGMDPMPRDYYEVLGVSRDAGEKDIKSAYRKMARKLHPDRNPDDPGAEEGFKELNEAYAVLSDKEQRRRYDGLGMDGFHAQVNPEDIYKNFDLSSIFEELGLSFGGRGRGRGAPHFEFHTGGGPGGGGFDPFGSQAARAPGRDVEQAIEIGLFEALHGATRSVQIRANDGNVSSVDVQIPPGITSGKKLRLRGRGLPRVPGGAPGDLYLIVRVSPHPWLRRNGKNLEVDAAVPVSILLLGGTTTVQTLDGERTVKVPPCTRPGAKLRLKGLGAPEMGGDGTRGDLHIVVSADLPASLSEEQEEAVKNLQELGL
jgi:curved DNA-binding protein